MTQRKMERRLRKAGFLVGLSLLIQALTATVVHPLAFVAFLLVGCPLMAAGVLYFLLGLVAGPEPDQA